MDGGDFLVVMCLRPYVLLMSAFKGCRQWASKKGSVCVVEHVRANLLPSRAEMDLVVGVMISLWGKPLDIRIGIGRSRRRGFGVNILRAVSEKKLILRSVVVVWFLY